MLYIKGFPSIWGIRCPHTKWQVFFSWITLSWTLELLKVRCHYFTVSIKSNQCSLQRCMWSVYKEMLLFLPSISLVYNADFIAMYWRKRSGKAFKQWLCQYFTVDMSRESGVPKGAYMCHTECRTYRTMPNSRWLCPEKSGIITDSGKNCIIGLTHCEIVKFG